MSQEISPCCLTIAGSDSGGNAGVQADLRAFHSYGLHGCTVFSALTAQNPFGVSAIHNVPPSFVEAQLDAVLGVYNIKALKTGMISDAMSISIIAGCLASYPNIAKVIDPVMIATSGARLVSEEALEMIVRRLVPLATLITPNLPEAEVLAGEAGSGRSSSADRAEELAVKLRDRFGCAVLVKGGHGDNAAAVDVLASDCGIERFEAAWVKKPISTHGTGCSLAAALAAELALGHDIHSAVRGAKAYVHQAIEKSYLVGPECGVLGFV